jgi:mevalonate kinase
MNNYPAKLLLFGEHTVNLGSQALAMPLTFYSGNWTYATKTIQGKSLETLQMQLPQLADFLDDKQHNKVFQQIIDVSRFRNALKSGLYFRSNIPVGYGAGSSGALIAALFDEFGSSSHAENDLIALRAMLANLESFFHGKSSGTDPLISLLRKPLLLSKDKLQLVELPRADKKYALFLLNTGISRQATSLIDYFISVSRNESVQRKIDQQLLPAVDRAIHDILLGNWEDLFESFHLISAFQLENLSSLIPLEFRLLWKKGLEGDLYKLKVCGAGGGGYILGLTNNLEQIIKSCPSYSILKVLRGKHEIFPK